MWWALLIVVPIVALLVLWVVGERGHVMLPSTRRAIAGRRDRARSDGGGGGVLRAVHGYAYGRFTYQYIKIAIDWLLPRMSPRLKRWWADRYHGKVLPTELACAVVRLDHDIPRRDLDQIVPYPMARDLVLDRAPSIVVLECPCRHARAEPCRPTDVCMLVGGGDFALEHHPGRARRISQQEALDLLEAEHRRGHVHTAYFKDACDDRFYAICNCCRCCCGGLEAMVEHGVPMVASSGYVAQVDEGTCIACGDCEEVCPFGAVTLGQRAQVDWERCMGCGVCEGQCETGAIALVRDARKGVPLDVRALGREPAVSTA
ncbi:MAG: 4Fe-4S binding protein [Gemmatimonadales bacterium]|jgi:Pyruvate/2-oxoacid:ferredoxin oxidoreductase delta subunit